MAPTTPACWFSFSMVARTYGLLQMIEDNKGDRMHVITLQKTVALVQLESPSHWLDEASSSVGCPCDKELRAAQAPADS